MERHNFFWIRSTALQQYQHYDDDYAEAPSFVPLSPSSSLPSPPPFPQIPKMMQNNPTSQSSLRMEVAGSMAKESQQISGRLHHWQEGWGRERRCTDRCWAAGTSAPCCSGKPDESSATALIALTTAPAALWRTPALRRDLRDGLARFASAFCHRAAYSQVTVSRVPCTAHPSRWQTTTVS
jgi:hypothetical protein